MDRDLWQRVAKFLVRHMGHTADERKNELKNALYGCQVIDQVPKLDTAHETFVSMLIDKLDDHGQCEGYTEPALVVLIKFIASTRGVNVQQEADALCNELLKANSDTISVGRAPIPSDPVPLTILGLVIVFTVIMSWFYRQFMETEASATQVQNLIATLTAAPLQLTLSTSQNSLSTAALNPTVGSTETATQSSTVPAVTQLVIPSVAPALSPSPDLMLTAVANAGQFSETSNGQWATFEYTFMEDNHVMMLVPGGVFTRGSTDERDEQPTRAIEVNSFWMDKFEVSFAQYAECVAANVCDPLELASGSNMNWPVTGLTWSQAIGYCQWRGSLANAEITLPTENEWEYAARGVNNWIYPWGNNFDVNNPRAVYADNSEFNGELSPVDVSSYREGSSWTGVSNLSGNVAELTRTQYGLYGQAKTETFQVSVSLVM
jgi:formylglycine-generating enzyme required for sulfatase activity